MTDVTQEAIAEAVSSLTEAQDMACRGTELYAQLKEDLESSGEYIPFLANVEARMTDIAMTACLVLRDSEGQMPEVVGTMMLNLPAIKKRLIGEAIEEYGTDKCELRSFNALNAMLSTGMRSGDVEEGDSDDEEVE